MYSQLLIRIFWFFLLLSCCFLSSVSKGCDSLNSESETIRILFVGNSLTYSNDLPNLVEQEAKKRKVKWVIEMIASPNLGLEDHWENCLVHEAIKTRKFDFLVIQQGPSSQSEGRQSLLEYGAKLKSLCDQYDTKLAFFMVWPAVPNFHTFDGVIKNYTDAAVQTNSILCPVGCKWKEFIDATGSLSYYGNDQFHPSLLGSQVAAQVIFESLKIEIQSR